MVSQDESGEGSYHCIWWQGVPLRAQRAGLVGWVYASPKAPLRM